MPISKPTRQTPSMRDGGTLNLLNPTQSYRGNRMPSGLAATVLSVLAIVALVSFQWVAEIFLRTEN